MPAPAVPVKSFANPFPVPTLEEQLHSIEEDSRETLYICPNAWALRHRFVNKESGEVIRARCDSWHCLYCGPRKVDQWRQLVKGVEPKLFITLTKVGWTVEEAARVLTTVVQYLRRGSRTHNPDAKGHRPAYPLEYFAVLERHSDFEENGFHWHLLVNGVDFIPNQVVSDALHSATKGRSYITKTKAVANTRAVGYVTKYLTKHISNQEKGVREQEREMIALDIDENGHLVERKRVEVVEVVSKARRIRYSRHFFPEAVAELRLKLFAQIEDAGEIGIDAAHEVAAPLQEEQREQYPAQKDGEQGRVAQHEPQTEEEATRSAWALVEREPFTHDLAEYRRRKAQALKEVVEDHRERGRRLNRRILTIWDYQRNEQYQARWAS